MRDRGSTRPTRARHGNSVAAGRSAGIGSATPSAAATTGPASAAKSWEKKREKAQDYKTGPASSSNIDKKQRREGDAKRARPKLTW
jgi:hypothetical protein